MDGGERATPTPNVPLARGASPRIVLFDLGGVLVPDFWETLWLTPGAGLADRLGVSRYDARRIGRMLWPHFDRTDRDELDYWEAFGCALGHPLPMALVREAEAALIRPHPQAASALGAARAAGAAIGIVSNNTAFWCPKQLALLPAEAFDPDLTFLSHRAAATKTKGHPDLYAIALERIAKRGLAAGAVVMVDDRADNVIFARGLGMHAVHVPPPQLLAPAGASPGGPDWSFDLPTPAALGLTAA